MRNELQELITNCEDLYNEYDTARIQVHYFYLLKKIIQFQFYL